MAELNQELQMQETNLTAEQKEKRERAKKQIDEHMNKTVYLVEIAVICAVIIMLWWFHLGYIKIGILAFTCLSVPVAVAAICLGVKAGAITGFVWGMTSFIQGLMDGAVLFAINPVGSFVTTVVTRTLVGILVGLVFAGFRKCRGKAVRNAGFLVASVACPVFNTILFMSSLMLFFYRTSFITDKIEAFRESGIVINNVFNVVVAMVGTQALIEAAGCGILGCIVAGACYGVVQKSIR